MNITYNIFWWQCDSIKRLFFFQPSQEMRSSHTHFFLFPFPFSLWYLIYIHLTQLGKSIFPFHPSWSIHIPLSLLPPTFFAAAAASSTFRLYPVSFFFFSFHLVCILGVLSLLHAQYLRKKRDDEDGDTVRNMIPITFKNYIASKLLDFYVSWKSSFSTAQKTRHHEFWWIYKEALVSINLSTPKCKLCSKRKGEIEYVCVRAHLT